MGACCGGSKAGKDGKQGGKIESMPVMKKPKGGPMVDKSKVTDSKKTYLDDFWGGNDNLENTVLGW